MADDRLKITVPDNPIELATPYPLTVDMGGYPVTNIVATWSHFEEDGQTPSVPDEYTTLAVMRRADGAAYVNLDPRMRGRQNVSIQVNFSDGKMAIRAFLVNVVVPKRAPSRLVVTPYFAEPDRNIGRISLNLASSKTSGLCSFAVYAGGDGPVPIRPTDVSFTVIPVSGMEAPIKLDHSTGIITAQSPGEALIKTSFAGLERMVCVSVSGPNGDSSVSDEDCHEIVPGGVPWGDGHAPTRVPVKVPK
jgi:hypothetical protein